MGEVHNTQTIARAHMLTNDQLQRELTYRAAMAVLKEMRDTELITAGEFVKIVPFLAQTFSPVWGHLYRSFA